MEDGPKNYDSGGGEAKSTQLMKSVDGPLGSRIEQPTVTMNLIRKRDRLETELKMVNKVLATLEKHPDAQEVLDAVSSISGII